MHLTVRQIDIIAYLLNCGKWCTSDQLSEEFILSRKTIQAEIKAISESPVIGPELEINSRKGYRLQWLTEESRQMLRESIWFYGGTRNSIGIRPSSLVLYLMFQQGYVSMQHLADAFFLSKTAISLEMETVHRWIDRQPGLTLEISGSRGIRLQGSELRKRMYSVKPGTKIAFGTLPLPAEIREDYGRYLDVCRDLLQHEMTQDQMLLTGEWMFQICRFISISMLRTKMGYTLGEKGLEQETVTPFVARISAQLEQRLDITLSQTEQKSIALMLRISDYIAKTPVETAVDDDMEERLTHFEVRTCELLGIPTQPLFPDRTQVLMHLRNMYLRMEKHQAAVNHYNEEIIRRYPLATHITHRLLPECFGLEITKEASFFSLFVQEALQKLHRDPSVLLVCNQNISIVGQIKHWLRRKGGVNIGRFDVLPDYAFELHPELREDYDILLTTQEEILLPYPEFYLIPSIMTRKEMDQLNFYIETVIDEKRSRKHDAIRECCLRETTVEGKELDLFSIIGCADDGTLSFHPYASVYLHVARMKKEGNPSIHIYHLNDPIMFRHKRVRELIFTEFSQGSDELLYLDQAVADILCEQL